MAEIDIGFDAIGLGAFDQAVEVGARLDAAATVREQPVLAPEGEGADGGGIDQSGLMVPGSAGFGKGPQNTRCPKNLTDAKQIGKDAVEYNNGNKWEIKYGGSRDWVSNNPGAVTRSPQRIGSYVALGITSPIFGSYSAGAAAQKNYWESSGYQNSSSMLEALRLWTGKNRPGNMLSENSAYVKNTLDAASGVTPNTPPNSLSSSQLTQVMNGQKQAEGWTSGTTTCGGGYGG